MYNICYTYKIKNSSFNTIVFTLVGRYTEYRWYKKL